MAHAGNQGWKLENRPSGASALSFPIDGQGQGYARIQRPRCPSLRSPNFGSMYIQSILFLRRLIARGSCRGETCTAQGKSYPGGRARGETGTAIMKAIIYKWQRPIDMCGSTQFYSRTFKGISRWNANDHLLAGESAIEPYSRRVRDDSVKAEF